MNTAIAMMVAMLFALVLAPAVKAQTADPVGNAEAGKKAWDARRCQNCHAEHGQGAFGPDLAGRQLTFAQFKHAVRKPWGVMPRFTERQASDQTLADMRAWLLTLPQVAEPGPWEVPLRADAPYRQKLLISVGCAQCHHSELGNPRGALGGVASHVTFEYFSKMVYNHTDIWRAGTMGDFSRDRVPEAILREIFLFVTEDLGLVVPLGATFVPEPTADGPNTTYKLWVRNRGIKDEGLTAEDVTITVPLKAGTVLLSATGGTGYQGVKPDPETKLDAAVWKVAKFGPGDVQAYMLTIAGKGAPPAEVFKGTTVRWAKPGIRPGIPDLEHFVMDHSFGEGRRSIVNATFNRPVSATGMWVAPGGTPLGLCLAVDIQRETVGCEKK